MTTPQRRDHSHHRLVPAPHVRDVSASSTPLRRERPPRRREPVKTGEVLKGRFRIERVIGSGGMGVVYGGRHLELDQPIAIKFLLAEDAGRDVRRFLSEARAVASLDSPHVARVLDAGVMETRGGDVIPFIVMERLKGCDLAAILAQRSRLPFAEAVEYVIQACAGAAEAHGAGIVHRDLKPANLFLTTRRDGAPLIKLLDFGVSKNLARAHRKTDFSRTAEGETIGSPLYMSPEQVRAVRHIDTRADIWSLGVILHQLLTGTTAFEGETTAELFVEILHSPPRSILQYAPDVPPALVDIVLRCLKKKRDARYATVEELAEALAPFRGAAPRVVVPMARRAFEDPGADADTLDARPSRTRGLRLATMACGAIGLVLLCLALFGMFRTSTNAGPITTEVGTTLLALPTPTGTELPSPTASTTTNAEASKPLPAPIASTAIVSEPAKLAVKPATRQTPSSPTTTTTRGTPSSSASARPVPSNAPRQRTDW